jgi:hypothetical protein
MLEEVSYKVDVAKAFPLSEENSCSKNFHFVRFNSESMEFSKILFFTTTNSVSN